MLRDADPEHAPLLAPSLSKPRHENLNLNEVEADPRLAAARALRRAIEDYDLDGLRAALALMTPDGAATAEAWAAFSLHVSPLHLLAQRRATAPAASTIDAMVQALVDAGVPVDASAPQHGLDTPLHRAASNGHVPMVEALLRAGPSVETDSMFEPLLATALLGGHVAVADRLLAAGAPTQTSDASQTQVLWFNVLRQAVQRLNADVTRWILTHVPDAPLMLVQSMTTTHLIGLLAQRLPTGWKSTTAAAGLDLVPRSELRAAWSPDEQTRLLSLLDALLDAGVTSPSNDHRLPWLPAPSDGMLFSYLLKNAPALPLDAFRRVWAHESARMGTLAAEPMPALIHALGHLASRYDLEALQAFQTMGVDFTATPPNFGPTVPVLHHFLQTSHHDDHPDASKTLRWLLNAGADVNAVMFGGSTPLTLVLTHTSIGDLRVDWAIALLDHGAEPNGPAPSSLPFPTIIPPLALIAPLSSKFQPPRSSAALLAPDARLRLARRLLDAGASPLTMAGPNLPIFLGLNQDPAFRAMIWDRLIEIKVPTAELSSLVHQAFRQLAISQGTSSARQAWMHDVIDSCCELVERAPAFQEAFQQAFAQTLEIHERDGDGDAFPGLSADVAARMERFLLQGVSSSTSMTPPRPAPRL